MVGLIPARAGKTPDKNQTHIHTKAHPRAGGENFLIVEVAEKLDGSSPRGRGKLLADQDIPVEIRLIPARAGKTILLTERKVSAWAHPRAGGENQPGCYHARVSLGSSPRGRGKLRFLCVWLTTLGLIPARAGKTLTKTPPEIVSAAHPRAGGENAGLLGSDAGTSGSSPRGRGKLTTQVVRCQADRLIPARAGKTHSTVARSVSHAAHPRAGGENSCS